MKRELIVGQSYTLQYTKSFCHVVGGDGFQNFSKKMNTGDTLENCTFVGIIEVEEFGERQIFYRKGKRRSYVMFSNENLNHIVWH